LNEGVTVLGEHFLPGEFRDFDDVVDVLAKLGHVLRDSWVRSKLHNRGESILVELDASGDDKGQEITDFL
jgi:hypothetical protein